MSSKADSLSNNLERCELQLIPPFLFLFIFLSRFSPPFLFFYLSAKIIHFQIESKRLSDIFIFLTKSISVITVIIKIIKNDNKSNNLFA